MKLIICLSMILTVKVLLTKGCSLIIILLSFVLKGKVLHKEEIKWNNYFLELSEHSVIKYVINIYLTATILSSVVAYFLFELFEFQSPLFFTIILTMTCVVLTLCKYLIKGKNEILNALRKIHQSVLAEEDNN